MMSGFINGGLLAKPLAFNAVGNTASHLGKNKIHNFN